MIHEKMVLNRFIKIALQALTSSERTDFFKLSNMA